jgi:hypothetical protein
MWYSVNWRCSIARTLHSTAREKERAFLVAVETRRNGSGGGWNSESSLEELGELVRTAGGAVVGRAVQKLESPHPAHYIGAGKLKEIVAQRQSLDYTLVVFDDELSPSQQRNLEKALDVKVLDRTALILDIFAMRARTREGRLQVELAQEASGATSSVSDARAGRGRSASEGLARPSSRPTAASSATVSRSSSVRSRTSGASARCTVAVARRPACPSSRSSATRTPASRR